MVQIFDLVQNAVAKKSKQPVPEQLTYESKVVEEKAQSGSTALYAQGLKKAAENFKNKDLNPNTISDLVKGLLNVEKTPTTQTPQDSGGLVGSLLSGLPSDSETEETDQSLGVDELLRANLAFFESKQAGDSSSEALMDALMAANLLGQTSHRSQSGSIVASTIMGFAKSFKQ